MATGAATGMVTNPNKIEAVVPPNANAAAPAPTAPTPMAPMSVREVMTRSLSNTSQQISPWVHASILISGTFI
ncbi:hypothetical protein [Nostoc sp.]|uniref:hypothetical protein n=1 Tax=Nostoc sp. TaxID=1180 RepID=UPI002FFA9B02